MKLSGFVELSNLIILIQKNLFSDDIIETNRRSSDHIDQGQIFISPANFNWTEYLHGQYMERFFSNNYYSR